MSIKKWFTKLWDYILRYGLGERDIWNMDETEFIVGILRSCEVLVPQEIKKYYTRNPMNREMITCVNYISAHREYIPSYIIIKGKSLLKRWLSDVPAQGYDAKTKWNISDSGYINTEILL